MKKQLTYLLLSCLLVLASSKSAFSQFSTLQKRIFSTSTLKKSGKNMGKMGLEAPLEDLVIDRDYRVFGTEPSWLLSKDGDFSRYYFNLLTDLVIGEYDINPETGSARNPGASRLYKEIKKTDKEKKENYTILQRALSYNSKIKSYILVSYYGDYGRENYRQTYYERLLADATIHKNIIDSLHKEINFIKSEYGIKDVGIVLDFKNIPTNQYPGFIQLVEKFSADFDNIVVKLPAVTAKTRFPKSLLPQLNELVNIMLIETHGFEDDLNITESNKMLNNLDNRFILERSFQYYADSTWRDKVILEVAYYGTAWESVGNDAYQLKPDKQFITLDQIFHERGRAGKVNYNQDSTLAYRKIVLENQNPVVHLFDDYKTLGRKYKWLDSLGCKGIGIWGLGYCSANDDESKKLWAAIGGQYGLPQTGMKWIIAAFLTLFLPLGFVYSIFTSWEVRNAVAKFRKYLYRFLLAFLAVLIIFLFCANIIPRNTVGFFVGMVIILGFFIYMKAKAYFGKVKRYQKMVQK